MSTFEIYNDFNELNFSDDSSLKDLFDQITKEVFGNNLQFAIIETTTIGNTSGVGTTQYIAYKGDKYIQSTIHKEYFDIIKVIKDTEFGSPSKYYDWYKRSEYYYAIGSNETNTKTSTSQTLNSKILEPHKKDWSAEQYITDYETKLTDDGIKQFFKQYVECLLKKDWFKELPHYFVLVKPISIKDETGLYIPLGNFYLKIGTTEKVDLKEYKKYVSHLQAAWFNKFGAKILKEYSDKKISDWYKPKTHLSKPLQNKLSKKLFKNGGNEITLNDFFYYAFDLDGYASLKDTHLFYSKHSFIQELIKIYNDKEKIKKKIKDTYDDKTDPLNILNKTVTGLKKIDEDSIKYFLLLLSKRRLALALLLVFGFTLEEAHTALAFGEKKTTKTTASVKDHTDFLLNNLFITQSNPVTNIIQLLADREELFLKNIVTEIKKENSSFTCKIST
ncbi:MAG: hypothetical protein LC120_02020 [Bacteroidales bacterium]|nr:hypothetical protein [Bacteroidales bacterium]